MFSLLYDISTDYLKLEIKKFGMKKNSELKSKLDSVIEKSNAQKKLLKKILTQLSKQNEELENHPEETKNKKK